MKSLDILFKTQTWAAATADELMRSPAWALPCRLGEKQCVMKPDEDCSAADIGIAVDFEGEAHLLGIPCIPAFPGLFSLKDSLDAVPETVLLALAEKECGPLFQLVENAVRRRLSVSGIAKPLRGDGVLYERIASDAGEDLLRFSISGGGCVASAFGRRENIDAMSQCARETPVPARTLYASFAVPQDELDSLAPGDAFALAEIDPAAASWPVSASLCGDAFVLSKDGAAPSVPGDGFVKVYAAEWTEVPFGCVADVADSPQTWESSQLNALSAPSTGRNVDMYYGGGRIARGRLTVESGMLLASVEALG